VAYRYQQSLFYCISCQTLAFNSIVRQSTYLIYSLISRTFFTWSMACILPAAYTRNISRGTKFSISNSLDGTEDGILWTDVRDDTHDTDEDDTYDELPYL